MRRNVLRHFASSGLPTHFWHSARWFSCSLVDCEDPVFAQPAKTSSVIATNPGEAQRRIATSMRQNARGDQTQKPGICGINLA